MHIEQFWQLIDATGGQPERGDVLTAALSTLPEDEIVRFQLLYDDVLQSANTVDLWGAAYLITGDRSDGAFSDFRADLIERAQQVAARHGVTIGRVFNEALASALPAMERAVPRVGTPQHGVPQ